MHALLLVGLFSIADIRSDRSSLSQHIGDGDGQNVPIIVVKRDLYSTEAVQHYARLNASAAFTRRDRERAAFLVRSADGSLRAIAWQPGEMTEASYKGRIPQRCIAIIHTHPIAAPQPSRRDVSEAQRIKLPIVVITPDGVTAAMPDGTIAALLGPGWTRLP